VPSARRRFSILHQLAGNLAHSEKSAIRVTLWSTYQSTDFPEFVSRTCVRHALDPLDVSRTRNGSGVGAVQASTAVEAQGSPVDAGSADVDTESMALRYNKSLLGRALLAFEGYAQSEQEKMLGIQRAMNSPKTATIFEKWKRLPCLSELRDGRDGDDVKMGPPKDKRNSRGLGAIGQASIGQGGSLHGAIGQGIKRQQQSADTEADTFHSLPQEPLPPAPLVPPAVRAVLGGAGAAPPPAQGAPFSGHSEGGGGQGGSAGAQTWEGQAWEGEEAASTTHDTFGVHQTQTGYAAYPYQPHVVPQIRAPAFARTLQAAGVDVHNTLNTLNTPTPQIPAPAFARTLQAGGVDSHNALNAHMNMNLNVHGNSGVNHASMPININHASMPLNVSAYASPFAWNGAMAHMGFYAGAPAPKDVAHSGGDGAHGARELELLAAAANSFQRLQNHHHQPQQYHHQPQQYHDQQHPLAPHASQATPLPHTIHSQPHQYQQQQPYPAQQVPSYTTPPCPDQHHNYRRQQQQHQEQQMHAQVCSSLLLRILPFCRILPYKGLFWSITSIIKSIKNRCTPGLFCCI